MAYRSLSLSALVAVSLMAMPLRVATSIADQAAGASGPLFPALQRGATADVARLLAGSVNVNAVDTDGTPALMLAVL